MQSAVQEHVKAVPFPKNLGIFSSNSEFKCQTTCFLTREYLSSKLSILLQQPSSEDAAIDVVYSSLAQQHREN